MMLKRTTGTRGAERALRNPTSVPVLPTSPCGSRSIPSFSGRSVVTHALPLDQLNSLLKVSVRKLPQKLKAALRPWGDKKEEEAKQAVSEFFSDLRREVTEARLAPDFAMYEAGHERKFSRTDYLTLLYDVVLPAVPDFQWSHVSTYEVDHEGFVLVTVQATGHHTGGPLQMPGLPAISASGRHFCLEEEAQMVRVQDGMIKEIKVFPVRGAGPRAMYAALGGQLPELPRLTELQKAQLPVP